MMRQTQHSIFRVFLLAAGLLLSTAAFAIDLDTAKKQGLVGERADGFLGVVVDSPSADVVALVKEVNDKRRKAYQQIAQKNGIDVADVEARAGQVAIDKTPPGGWIFVSRWEKKP